MNEGKLHGAIGQYPHTAALFDDPALRIDAVAPISRAFRPMVREERYDFSEMAIATLLMARAAGSSLVLLPVVMAARAQNGALLRRREDGFGPDGLAGQRVGVRAYGQTTALWLRGDLAEAHGVRPEDLRWVTFEEAHVAGVADPPWAERAADGSDMEAMLRDGTLDAAIFGGEVPDDPAFAPVFADPAAAGRAFVARHGFTPVNHMVVMRADRAARPGVARALLDRLGADNPHPRGRAALDPAVRLAIRYAEAQGLIGPGMTVADAWAGLPDDCAGG